MLFKLWLLAYTFSSKPLTLTRSVFISIMSWVTRWEGRAPVLSTGRGDIWHLQTNYEWYSPALYLLTSECEKEEADWCGCDLRHPFWMCPHSGANFPKTSPGSLFVALSPALDLGGSRKSGLGMICRHSGRWWLMRPRCFAPQCQSEHWAPVAAHVTLYLPQSRVTDADPPYVSCSCVTIIIAESQGKWCRKSESN